MSSRSHNRLLGGIGEAFANRNFRVYSAGSIASWTSYFVQLVAVSWLTWELTGSTLWLAAMALLDIVPGVILMPFTGAFADRHDRHRIMIWVCVLSLLQAAALAVFSWIGVLGVGLLGILVFIHSVLIAFMVPAMYGTLPRFVARPVLASAIAVSSAYVQVAVFAGPAFAGLIITAYGVSWAFFVNALGYLILTVAFLALRTPDGYEQPAPESGTVFSQIKDGVVYLIADRRILALLILGLSVNALTMGIYHMMPAYAELVLGMGVMGMSLVLSSAGAGATVAALWLARVSTGDGAVETDTDRVIWSVPAALIVCGTLLWISNLYFALLIAFALGITAEIRKVCTMTIVQMTVDERQRGRVMATWFMFAQIAGGVGTYGIGQAAVSFGLQIPALVAATVGIAIWLAIYLNRRRLIDPSADSGNAGRAEP